MAKLGTFCKNCTFYDNKNKSCYLRYVEQFESEGANVQWSDQGPVIDRVCPARRGLDWCVDLTLSEKEQKLKDELNIFGTIILLAEDLDSLENSLQTLKTINNIEKFKIVICHKDEITSADIKSKCEVIDFAEYRCVKCFISNDIQMYDEAFKRAKNGFTFFLKSSEEIDPLIIDKMNYAINYQLKRILLVEPYREEDIHGMVVMSIVHQWLKGNLQANIADKIEAISEEQNIQAPITSWEKLNELYKNKS